MYNIAYRKNGGEKVPLTFQNGYIISTISGLMEHTVNLSKSQGYGQLGETVQSAYLQGKNIVINGKITGEKYKQQELLDLFQPLSEGRLWWDNSYWIDTVVSVSPQIAQKEEKRFSLRLFAPFPFWHDEKGKNVILGGVTPLFSFPVMYDRHIFGRKENTGFVNCYNDGNIETQFDLTIHAESDVKNITIENATTFQKLAFTGEISAGQTIRMFRQNNRLYITLDDQNKFSLLDESSDFFSLAVKDNLIVVLTESGTVSVEIQYYNTYIGVTDGI